MCVLEAFFTTENNDVVRELEVVSIDVFYKECFSFSRNASQWMSVNYDGESSFHMRNSRCFE